jgi:hypothetical protein
LIIGDAEGFEAAGFAFAEEEEKEEEAEGVSESESVDTEAFVTWTQGQNTKEEI